MLDHIQHAREGNNPPLSRGVRNACCTGKTRNASLEMGIFDCLMTKRRSELQDARRRKGYMESLIKIGDEFCNEHYTHRWSVLSNLRSLLQLLAIHIHDEMLRLRCHRCWELACLQIVCKTSEDAGDVLGKAVQLALVMSTPPSLLSLKPFP